MVDKAYLISIRDKLVPLVFLGHRGHLDLL